MDRYPEAGESEVVESSPGAKLRWRKGGYHFIRSYAECSRIDADLCSISGAEPWTQYRRDRHHGHTAWLAVGTDVGDARYRLLALPAARGAGRGLSGAALHDPA